MGQAKGSTEQSPERTNDASGVPDIHRRRNLLAIAGIVLACLGFWAGYRFGTTRSLQTERTGESRRSANPRRPVEIRVEPSSVRLADTTLELRELPPPPKQVLDGTVENP